MPFRFPGTTFVHSLRREKGVAEWAPSFLPSIMSVTETIATDESTVKNLGKQNAELMQKNQALESKIGVLKKRVRILEKSVLSSLFHSPCS